VHRLLREWGKAAGGADEHLLPLMRQDRDSSRYDVAVTLIMMQGPNAKMGVEPMRRGLRNIGSDGDCSEALHHFALLKSHGKVFLPELRTLLDSPNQYDREEALRAIGAIGPDAKELLPELRRRLENATSESARRNLEDAIKEISRKEHFQ
jgi:HEAT repeat protein